MSLTVMDASVLPAMTEQGIGYAHKTLCRLTERADADGVVSVPLAWTMEGTGLGERQQLRHLRLLEEHGWIQRIDGGYRGKSLVIVIKRWLSDATAFIAHRARRAVYAARRKRWDAIRAYKQRPRVASLIGRASLDDPQSVGSLMPDMGDRPLTSLEGEQGAKSAPLHSFIQGELLGICGQCEFPEANARHRKTKTRTAWSNTRTSA